MTLACARCGFPNPEDAVRCRACSAPLQDTSSDAAIKPKLRQIIAETRARTRARQRRGVTVNPNRVDVVPRLPSGVVASDTALKTALEKSRQARLEGLREELRKGRQAFVEPVSQSIPPQVLTTPPAPASAPTACDTQPSASEPTSSPTEQIAEAFLERAELPVQAPAEPVVEPPKKAPPSVPNEHDAPGGELTQATEPEPAIEHHPSAGAEEPQQAGEPELPFKRLNPSGGLQPAQTEPAHEERLEAAPKPIQPVKVASDPPTQAEVPQAPQPVTEPEAQAEEPDAPRTPSRLNVAARKALKQLQEAAQRLGQTKPKETVEVSNACALYGWRRLGATLIDSVPVGALTSIWVAAELSAAKRPPEEVLATWLLGESGGIPWGVLLIALSWLVWCWVGIFVWGATPGMKLTRLSWVTQASWRRFARPPLFLLSLLPLGLGGTYALVDKNSRAFSDILLRITWRTE